MEKIIFCAILLIIIAPLVVADTTNATEVPDSVRDMIASQKSFVENMTKQAQEIRQNMTKFIEQTKADMEKTRKEIQNQTDVFSSLGLNLSANKISDEQNQKAIEASLRENIAEQQKEINLSLESIKQEQREIYEHQAKMKAAIRTLIIAQKELTKIPENISPLAYEINTTLDNATLAEENIKNRNAVVKAIFGGDKASANILESTANANQEKVDSLKVIVKSVPYSNNIKSLLMDQINVMENEQMRIISVASGEKENNGVFGWIWS